MTMSTNYSKFNFAAAIFFIVLFFFSNVVLANQLAFPAGAPVQDTIRFQYAIYYLPTSVKDPSAVLSATAEKLGFKLKAVSQIPKIVTAAVYSARVEKNVRENYAPPDMRSLQYFAFGLSRTQAEALQNSQQALIINFSHPKAHVWNALHAANLLVETVARETNGLVWDDETRLIFSPDEWRKRRIESWSTPFPDVSKQTTIHAYKSNDYVRAITLGMAKFGLPDVTIQNVSWSSNRSVGNVINIFSQVMTEGAKFAKPGEYDLDLKAVKNASVREAQVSTLKSNALSVAYLTLKQGVNEAGDPANRLIEITFDRYPGKDVHAKQNAMFSALFGFEDSVSRIRHNTELLAASQKAKDQLPALYKAFTAGLAPGEFIQFKAPFATDDGGNEWMWVEVIEWKEQKIKGLLKNEPLKISNLHGGQIVEIKQKDIFDFLRVRPNGNQEGNETSKIILKMEEKK